jgi:hypothetical protein
MNLPLLSLIAFITSVAINFAEITWYVKIDVNASLFSGFNKVVAVPSCNLSNASFTGAKTVKGPSLFKVLTKVVKLSLEAAIVTIVSFCSTTYFLVSTSTSATFISSFFDDIQEKDKNVTNRKDVSLNASFIICFLDLLQRLSIDLLKMFNKIIHKLNKIFSVIKKALQKKYFYNFYFSDSSSSFF